MMTMYFNRLVLVLGSIAVIGFLVFGAHRETILLNLVCVYFSEISIILIL